ncbi:hypothetical protein pb186bvf_005495 [Paramecium bursaria]
MIQDYYQSKSSQRYQSTFGTINSQTRNQLSVRSTNRNLNSYCVPCMNCESLVPLDDIDKHCLKCTSVSKNVTAILKSNQLDEINFKISKLRESIKQLLQEEFKEDNQKYLCRADELCEQIASIQNHNNIEFRKLQDFNQELKTLTEQYRGSLGFIRLGCRSRPQPQLRVPNRQESSRQSTNQYGRPTMITKFSGGSQERSNNIPELKSEILTQMSTSKWDQEESQNSHDFELQNQDALQRMFYSKCLQYKMKLPNTHPSQKIPLIVLFKEIQQKKVPQQLWDKYIQEAMNNPSNYLDMNKVSGLKNNLRNIASEQQFKRFTGL